MSALQGFHRPSTVAEALALLAQDPDAKPLAGGATLVAMLNARVLEPAALISLAGIAEIQGHEALADGRVRIGAFTRHRDTASSTLLDSAQPASCATPLRRSPTRRCATWAPSADRSRSPTPGSTIRLRWWRQAPTSRSRPPRAADGCPRARSSSTGTRPRSQPGELVTAVLLPRPPGRGRGLYIKHARVAGDYATASVAACAMATGACASRSARADRRRWPTTTSTDSCRPTAAHAAVAQGRRNARRARRSRSTTCAAAPTTAAADPAPAAARGAHPESPWSIA